MLVGAIQHDIAFDPPVQECTMMAELRREARAFARTTSPMIFEGEVGTGRTVLARSVGVHRAGKSMPLVVVRAAEYRLAGSAGSVNRALVILGVDELPQADQLILAQWLQSRRVQFSGTARDLRKLVGPLRDATSHASWTLPPLRCRGDDAVAWARHFLYAGGQRSSQVSARYLGVDAEDRIRKASWPGNLQQLKNAVEHAGAMGDGTVISAEDLGLSQSNGETEMRPARTKVVVASAPSGRRDRVAPVRSRGGIPHPPAPDARNVRYRLDVLVGRPLAGMHCLNVTIVPVGRGQTSSSSSSMTMAIGVECRDGADVQVALCDARNASVVGNTVTASVGRPFELFFRLRARSTESVRVQLRDVTGAASLEAFLVSERFDVEACLDSVLTAGTSESKEKPPSADEWLLALPDGGVRNLFRHVWVHGIINEADATHLLGSPREFRKFSRELEKLSAVVPFRVRVEVSSGTKCYMREDD